MEHLLKCVEVEVDPHLVHFLLSKLGFNPDYHYINVWFEQSLSTSIRSETKWNGVSLETFSRLKDSAWFTGHELLFKKRITVRYFLQ